MQGQMPQEIEVWYIIPALRREIAKSMVDDYKLTQKQVSELLGITEAAVSQYRSSKRAKEIVFSNAVLEEIKKSAKKIMENKKLLVPEMIGLCNLTGVKQIMCNLHRKQDTKLNKCGACFKEK
jgi:predicted transcriptional regulator